MSGRKTIETDDEDEDTGNCNDRQEASKLKVPESRLTKDDRENVRGVRARSQDSERPSSNDQQVVKKNRMITNPEEFTCSMCRRPIAERRGVVIRDCLHHFCQMCLFEHSMVSSDRYIEVKCPKRACGSMIEDEVINALLGDDYEMYALKVAKLRRFKGNKYENGSARSHKNGAARMPRQDDRDDQNERRKFADKKSDLTEEDLKVFRKFQFSDDFVPANDRRERRQEGLIRSPQDFNCLECKKFVAKHESVIFTRCPHLFCKHCLRVHIINSSNTYVKVKCPMKFCKNMAEDEAVEELLGHDYERYSKKIEKLIRSKRERRNSSERRYLKKKDDDFDKRGNDKKNDRPSASKFGKSREQNGKINLMNCD